MTGRVNLTIRLVMTFVWLCLPGIATAVERHVPSQYPTIQGAINTAVDGDTVIVAPGTYTGTGNRDIDFKGKAITVRSTNPNDPNIVAATIINCQGGISGFYRGFYFHNSEDANSTVAGFTIKNGYVIYGYGGGIYCNNSSSPAITNCTFSKNSAAWGGGMANYSSSSPTITNCTFSKNSAETGGGMANRASSSPTITNCTFSGNLASSDGGGMCNYSSSSSTITNCTFSGNSTTFGGGMVNSSSSPTLTSCTFSGNSASNEGGGMCNYSSSSPTITNCTFSRNSAPPRGGGMYNSSSSPTLANCILWDNTATNGPQIYNSSSTTTVSFSDVQSGWAGTGNINANPLFVNAAGGDLHLFPNSPCINAGNPGFVPKPNETDIDGEPRVMSGRVDMGVDEFFDPLEIKFIVVDKRRVGRTLFEYDCEVTLTNISRFAVRNVQLEIVKASENMVVIDPNVTFGNIEIGPGESATSIDMCTFQVDRSEATEPAEIIWKSTYEMVDGVLGIQDTASGLSFLNLGVAGDITGNGKVDLDDLKVLADQWLQPPGVPSADIAPTPADGIVNFFDYAVLAEHWLEGF